MRFTALCVLIVLAGFTGTALAADAVSASDPSLTELAKLVLDAVMNSRWWALAAYGVILACAGVRYFMPASWKTGVKGDIIGTALVFATAFGGAVATVLVAPGAAMTGAVALTALKVAIAAIGGYTIVHKVTGWLIAWGKLPAWLKPPLSLLALIVGSSVVKKAEAAGAAAVAAKPPTGMSGGAAIREVE